MIPTYSVVLVDDHAPLRSLYRTALEASGGFHVLGEAGDGEAGVEVVKALKPDVVLLDLSMPTMDGLEALQALREASPETRVVILSGFGKERMGAVTEKMGASAYIEKGVSPLALKGILTEVVSKPPPAVGAITRAELSELATRIRELV